LRKGSVITTISIGKSLVGSANITEELPQDFGIYDVPEFLGSLSLFEDPELQFHEKYLTIQQGNSSLKYFAANEDVLVRPKKFPSLGEPEISFDLSSANITAILKTASILKTSDVRFVGDGEVLSVVVGDKSNNTSNNFVLQLGETDKKFSVSINTDNMKIIPSDFSVGVINRRMIRLLSENLTYIIAIEEDSSFED